VGTPGRRPKSKRPSALISRELMQTLTEHCGYVRLNSRRDGAPDKVREQAAQRYTERTSALIATMRARCVATGVPESELPTVALALRKPPDRYFESWTPRDPLDPIYWNLREFSRRGQLWRLLRCPVCQHYFIQGTRREQRYCAPSCRRQAYPTPPQKNAEYQRQRRRARVEQDLGKIRQAKKALGHDERDLETVLAKAGISRRRWISLRRHETQRYGKPRATALP
jgi:hypothetical protein